MTVNYEWDVETIDLGDGTDDDLEVIDHYHCQNFKEAHAKASEPVAMDTHRHDIVLVRDDDSGRSWAYLTDGKLPEHFSDAYGNETSRVPQKFHKEVLTS